MTVANRLQELFRKGAKLDPYERSQMLCLYDRKGIFIQGTLERKSKWLDPSSWAPRRNIHGSRLQFRVWLIKKEVL